MSYASSIDSFTLLQILVGLLAVGAVAMIYVNPRFKDFVLHLICVIYPFVQTLDTLEGDDPGLLKAWFSYWLVYAIVRVAKRVCKLDQSRLPYLCYVEICFFIWIQHPSFGGAQRLVGWALRLDM